MNLKEIAAAAIDEATETPEGGLTLPGLEDEQQEMTEAGTPDSPVAVSNNPDGTVTYSLEISFDPAVQKKMAKAMPKSVKRDDLADDLGKTEESGEGTEEVEEETAGDSDPRGIFATALDEISAECLPGFSPAEDAAPSRHSKTPLENCRAKDPMYCPYHGDKAIKKAIEKNLVTRGVGTFTVNVTPNGNGKYGISVTTPIPDPKVATAIIGAFFVGNNMKDGIALTNPTGPNVTAEIDKDADPDREVSMLDEWMDDLMLDIADDPSLTQELDPQDMRDLLDARDTLAQTPPAVGGQPTSSYVQALKDARAKYHALRAQIDNRHIQSPLVAKTTEDNIEQHMKNLSGDYHAEKAPVDAAKKAIFPNGRFPNGFAKSHPWASDYNLASTRVGYFCQKAYDDAWLADKNLAVNDLKGRRTAISAMSFAREQYSDALDDYKKEVPEFMKEFENWAQGELSAGRITRQQFDTAFPHPFTPFGTQAPAQQAQPSQQGASGKVTLPQGWSNFVMGDNLVMPTDGLSDIPYGSEQGFSNAFDGSFPNFQVPDAFESFEINPISGEVVYSMTPGVAVSNANAPKNFVNALWGAGYTGAKLRPLTNGKPGFEVVIPFNANLAGK